MVERAIAVVDRLADQFDAVVHIDGSAAPERLETTEDRP
jgi:hypothetical protein